MPSPDFTAQVVAGIRTEMARQDLRQADLARKMGRSEIWVSRRLSARSQQRVELTLSEIEEIAAALDVDTQRLFGVPA